MAFINGKEKIGNCVNGYTFSQWGDMKYGECGFGSTHYSMIRLNWCYFIPFSQQILYCLFFLSLNEQMNGVKLHSNG